MCRDMSSRLTFDHDLITHSTDRGWARTAKRGTGARFAALASRFVLRRFGLLGCGPRALQRQFDIIHFLLGGRFWGSRPCWEWHPRASNPLLATTFDLSRAVLLRRSVPRGFVPMCSASMPPSALWKRPGSGNEPCSSFRTVATAPTALSCPKSGGGWKWKWGSGCGAWVQERKEEGGFYGTPGAMAR